MGVETSWDSRQVQIAAFTIKVFGLVSYTFVSGSKHHTMTLRPLVGFLEIPNFQKVTFICRGSPRHSP